MLFSLSIFTFLQDPRSPILTFSNLIPRSSEITCPPVRIAISSNIAFLLSPNPGALTATTFRPPLNLFTTKVAKASPSTSSEIIINGLLACTTDSSKGTIGCRLVNFFSTKSTKGFSSSVVIFSVFVTK